MNYLVISVLNEGAQYIGQRFNEENIFINYFPTLGCAKEFIAEHLKETYEDCVANQDKFEKMYPPPNTIKIIEDEIIKYGDWTYSIQQIPHDVVS